MLHSFTLNSQYSITTHKSHEQSVTTLFTQLIILTYRTDEPQSAPLLFADICFTLFKVLNVKIIEESVLGHVDLEEHLHRPGAPSSRFLFSVFPFLTRNTLTLPLNTTH